MTTTGYDNRGFNVFILNASSMKELVTRKNIKHAIVDGNLYIAVDAERTIRFIDATFGFNDTCVVWTHVSLETLVSWGFVEPHAAAEIIKGEKYLTDLSVKELLD